MSLFKVAYSEDLGDLIAKRKEKAVTLIDGIAGVKSEDIAASLFRADLDPPTAVRGFIAYQLGIVRLWLVNPKAFDIGNCSAYHLNPELYR